MFRHEECLINVTGNVTTVSLRITLSLTKENLTLPDNACCFHVTLLSPVFEMGMCCEVCVNL